MENETVKISGGGVSLSEWKCIEKDVEGLCNPNLLINTDFTNPVNQRGQNEYTGYGYCIDMWQSQQDTVTVTLTDKGIIVKGGAIANKIEDSIRLLTGELLTLSVKFYDGVIYKGSGVATTGTHVYDHFIKINAGDRGNFYMQYDGTSYRAVIEGYIDNKYPVSSIKLELGTVSTLKNEIVKYDFELWKCQRYYINSTADDGVIGEGYSMGEGMYFINIKCPNEMRILPTIGFNGSVAITDGLDGYQIESAGAMTKNRDNLEIVVKTAEKLEWGKYVKLKNTAANTHYALSAEL